MYGRESDGLLQNWAAGSEIPQGIRTFTRGVGRKNRDIGTAHEPLEVRTDDLLFDESRAERGKLAAEIEEYLRDCNVQELAILREILSASRLALKKHAFFSKN